MMLAFGRGRGFLGAVTRWATLSKYAHVAAVTPEGVYESLPWKGVRKRDFWTDTEGLDFFVVAGAYENKRALAFLKANVGRDYDWLGALRFLPRWGIPGNRHKMFCSEYVFAALRFAGIDLLRIEDPKQVTPGLLACSPLLHKVPSSTPKT